MVKAFETLGAGGLAVPAASARGRLARAAPACPAREPWLSWGLVIAPLSSMAVIGLLVVAHASMVAGPRAAPIAHQEVADAQIDAMVIEEIDVRETTARFGPAFTR